jgi:hypothetical protein
MLLLFNTIVKRVLMAGRQRPGNNHSFIIEAPIHTSCSPLKGGVRRSRGRRVIFLVCLSVVGLIMIGYYTTVYCGSTPLSSYGHIDFGRDRKTSSPETNSDTARLLHLTVCDAGENERSMPQTSVIRLLPLVRRVPTWAPWEGGKEELAEPFRAVSDLTALHTSVSSFRRFQFRFQATRP